MAHATPLNGAIAGLPMTTALPLAVQMPPPSSVATALQHAIKSIDMLTDDSFRKKVEALLESITAALQTGLADRPTWPSNLNRRDNLNQLKDSNKQKPLRAAVYDVIDKLIDVGWPTMSSTARSRKRYFHFG